MNICTVSIEHINQVWPLVKGFIEESEKKGLAGGSLDYNTDQILVYLTIGQWILLVATDDDNKIHGAATVSFINYPLNRVAYVTSVGGKFIIDKDSVNQLKNIAKHHGATKIQAMARPPMVRLLQSCGMQSGNTLVESII